MIRAENAISHLVSACPRAASGTLTTENILDGQVTRLKANGDTSDNIIPPWFRTRYNANPQTLFWLCCRLGYSFDIDLNPQVRFRHLAVDGMN